MQPMHDIAAVIGSQARFECIVQSDSPFSIEWRKDGEVLRNSELCQISLRNGVCKLTLLKTYMCKYRVSRLRKLSCDIRGFIIKALFFGTRARTRGSSKGSDLEGVYQS